MPRLLRCLVQLLPEHLMDADVTSQFVSLRRALKICSFAFLALSMFQILPVLVSVGRTGVMVSDLMGSESLPQIYILANSLRDNILIVGLGMLVALGVALAVTIRSKGGVFLYVNMGLSLLMGTASSYILMAAQEALKLPLMKLYQ